MNEKNLYYVEVEYESRLHCDLEWNRYATPMMVKASDFVLASTRIEAARLFHHWHKSRFALKAVKVQDRGPVDIGLLNLLTLGEEPKPVGDMALFEYWAQLHGEVGLAA